MYNILHKQYHKLAFFQLLVTMNNTGLDIDEQLCV
jgi:hypothetical protein